MFENCSSRDLKLEKILPKYVGCWNYSWCLLPLTYNQVQFTPLIILILQVRIELPLVSQCGQISKHGTPLSWSLIRVGRNPTPTPQAFFIKRLWFFEKFTSFTFSYIHLVLYVPHCQWEFLWHNVKLTWQ